MMRIWEVVLCGSGGSKRGRLGSGILDLVIQKAGGVPELV